MRNATCHLPVWRATRCTSSLNGFASLHPALSGLMDSFNAGDLAVIHRAGYANSTRSHFDGQRIWENGDPTQPEMFEGWLARYIDENLAEFDGKLPVLTAQPLSPVIVRGRPLLRREWRLLRRLGDTESR